MINIKDMLTVLHDASGIEDYSPVAADFTRDEFSFTVLGGEHIYLGLDKPFGASYVCLTTPSTNPRTMSAQFWNGSSWVAVSYLRDETQGLTRSGFLFWDKSKMQKSAVGGKEKFYVRISLNNDSTEITFRGINLVLADDVSLRSNFPPIIGSDMYPVGESSHILTHVSARDEILMELRKRYQKHRPDSEIVWEMINVWDLIDIFELREAACYLALAKIFFNLSDNPEDHWYKKYTHWSNKYQAAFEVAYLSIDKDGDGKDDIEEVQQHKNSASLIR